MKDIYTVIGMNDASGSLFTVSFLTFDKAKEYNLPPKDLARNFISKALGTVGDILGIAIGVVCNAGRTIVTIAGTIANGIINLIESIFNGAVRIITLNKTCVA